MLVVGTRIARKNTAALDAAASALEAADIDLVAAGGRPLVHADEEGDAMRRLGYVPDELLPSLYPERPPGFEERGPRWVEEVGGHHLAGAPSFHLEGPESVHRPDVQAAQP